MQRRRFLGAAGLGLTGSLAGCTSVTSLFQTSNSREPPLVENRPDAIYIPTHEEGMEMIGMGDAGDLKVGLMYSYAHRFWMVENDGGEWVSTEVPFESDDTVHLMAIVWEPETGVVVPSTDVTVEVTNSDGLVYQEVVYPMFSQQMGVHYGDNVALDGNDVYTVTVTVAGVPFERFGSFEGKFAEAATAEIQFDYREGKRNDIPYQLLEDRQGERGALPAMEMEMPTGVAPDSLPGETIGEGTSENEDLTFRAQAVTDERFGDAPYLLVSPRTRYNGYLVPGMSLSATVERDGETAFDGELRAGLDPEAGLHYGAPVEGLTVDDGVTVAVDVPTQLARHEGYETAFFDVDDVTVA
ncbi:Fe2+ transport protein [Halogranum amylolyticum]|uniref:Fe2+ transport protein n=1 Tax=Halogranum amylolyticum TaxID=660520 RepID=A0A1H8U4F9_9EURY|nr:iron transporter [Halogranum amylolyticum]SEO98035.1 Fe2+ transport protein [Halogranum amylolyticum]